MTTDPHDQAPDKADPSPKQNNPWARENLVGRSIGPYRIIQELGAGGMGAVFLGEQKEPVERMVAIKFVTLSLLNEEAQERFAVEQRVLARMTHPSIAHFYECGKTGDGLPYYVMEYVDGSPITSFCDAEGLNLEERLALFIKVCEAISHAHLKGIVHRDIKPSNVLVAGSGAFGLPKVIDFGIAKPLGGSWDLTQEGFFHGSYRYMSPEQAGLTDVDGNRIEADQRTDVYLLGILLYELLTGQPPFDWEDIASGVRVIDDICFKDPIRPGLCWKQLSQADKETRAKTRNTPSQAWGQRLTGDPDWIIMKALEKDPDRRYRSPMDLAADLTRFLEDKPVEAGPPDFQYRWGKFFRRNKTSVLIFGLVFAIMLLLPLSFFTAKVMEQKQTALERDRAQAALASTEKVTNFLIEIFEQADPFTDGSQEISARELLDRAVANMEESFEDGPETQIALLNILGRVYSHLDKQNDASQLLTRAAELYAANEHMPLKELAVNELELGWVRFHQGQYEESEELLRSSIQHFDALSPEPNREKVRAGMGLANVLFKKGRLEDALSTLEGVEKQALEVFGNQVPSYAETLNDLAMVNLRLGNEDIARNLLDQTRDIYENGIHPDLPMAAICLNNSGELELKSGNFSQAEIHYLEAIELGSKVMDADNYALSIFSSGLGLTYTYMGRYDEAAVRYEKAIEIGQKTLGAQHPEVATFIHNIGSLHIHRNQFDKAEARLSEALEIFAKSLGTKHHRYAMVLNTMGNLYLKKGELDQAEQALNLALEIYTEARGPDHSRTATVELNLGRLDAARSNWASAETRYKKALAVYKKKLRPNHPHLGRTHFLMAELYEAMGDKTQALEHCLKALEIRQNSLRPDHPHLLATLALRKRLE